MFLAKLRERFPDWAAKLGEDRVLDLGVLGEVSDTALTREQEIGFAESGLPITFVPGRNLVFLDVRGSGGLPARAWRAGRRNVRDGLLRLSRLPARDDGCDGGMR